MTKKRISFTLIILLLLLSVTVSAVPNDLYNGDATIDKVYLSEVEVGNSESSIALKILGYLGIMDIDKFKPEFMTNYTEYIFAISAIAGCECNAVQLVEANLIKDSTDDYITMEDVIYSGLELTGYSLTLTDRRMNAMVAHEAGLTYKVNYVPTAVPTKAEFAQLLYNIISVKCKEMTKISLNGRYELEDAEPILKRKYDIELREGIVTGICGQELYLGDETPQSKVRIDRKEYDVFEMDGFRESLGMRVAFFMKNDDKLNPVALFCEYEDEQNTVTEIKPYQTEDFSENEVTFRDDMSKKRKLRINRDTIIVYNGNNAGNYTASLMKNCITDTANITAVDNNGDGITDVLFIWNYENLSVNNITEREKINFKYDMQYKGKSYIDVQKLREDGVIEIICNDKETDVTAIKENDIVSIAQSNNSVGKTFTRIVISRTIVSGVLEEMSNDSQKTVYTVGGKQYIVLASYIEQIQRKAEIELPKIGSSYSFILNFDGVICDISKVEYMYGLLTKTKLQKGLDEQGMIKLLTTTDGFKIFDLADKVRCYDGSTKQGVLVSESDAIARLNSAKPDDDPRYVIRYSLNDAGAVNEVFLPLDNTANVPGGTNYSMTLDFSEDVSARYYAGFIAAKYFCGTAMKVFCMPQVQYIDQDDYYQIKAINYKGSDYTFPNIKLYSVDDLYTAKIGQTVENVYDIQESLPVMLIDNLKQKLVGDEPMLCVSGWENGEYKSLYCRDENLRSLAQSGWTANVVAKDLEIGDLVQFNKIGENVIAMKILFRASNPGEYRIQANSGDIVTWGNMNKLNMVYGRFIKNSSDIALLDLSANEDCSELSAHQITQKDNKFSVYEIDLQRKKISKMKVNDIETNDKVVLHKNYLSAKAVFVYR